MKEQTTSLAANHERAFTTSVNAAYNEAKSKVEAARQGNEDAIDAISACGALLESAKSSMRGRFTEWLTMQAQIHPDEAKKIMSVYHDRERQINKRTLQNAGILELATNLPPHKERPHNPFGWCRWVPKITAAISKDEVDRMNESQRAVARSTMRPLVDSINEAYKLLQ